MTADLVAWLTQILDEDEARERERTENGPEWLEEAAAYGAPDPRHVLADIAAKRARIALHQVEWRQRPDHEIGDSDDPWCAACLDEDWPCPTLRLEASAYAARPGYDEEWRP